MKSIGAALAYVEEQREVTATAVLALASPCLKERKEGAEAKARY
jgi:hypothetical protein